MLYEHVAAVRYVTDDEKGDGTYPRYEQQSFILEMKINGQIQACLLHQLTLYSPYSKTKDARIPTDELHRNSTVNIMEAGTSRFSVHGLCCL